MLDSTNNDTKHLMKLLTKFNPVQLIKSPIRTTATTKTIIDHIITNRSVSVSKSGISDHDAVFMIKSMKLPKLKASPRLLNVRNYKKFNLKAFRKDMNNVPFDEIKNISLEANEMWTLRTRKDFSQTYRINMHQSFMDKLKVTKSHMSHLN